MASKGDIERPISLVKPAHAKSVQAILDRAHRQEASANEALARTVDKALRPPRGKGLLSKTLGMALSHHGRMKKGGPSLRPVAPDTKGRAFHFSHSTVGRTSGASSGRGASTATNTASIANGPITGSGASPKATKPTTKTAGTPPAGGQQDLGSKEAGHQQYVERDAALARDAAEEFGIEVGAHRQPSPSQVREATEGMEPGQGIHKERVQGKEEDQKEAEPTQERARPIVIDVAAMQKEIAKAARGRRTQSAEAAQAYIEDPTKVARQVRHGHSNSFGTIGETFEERVAFWNAVQKHEREKDARTQVRLVLELPHEATPAARQEIVKRFCEEYERLGVPYWASIHAPTKKNDNRNHHAHIVHGLRPARMMVDPATGEKAWDFTITETYRTACRHKKTTHPHRQNVVKEFRNRDYVRDTRKRFAETANQVLEKAGCPIRYDARSYKNMGLDTEPMKHVARILTDKSKIHDFVVMDPEWTRRMIEQEMNAAAVERDKTYMDLKRVEKRLPEVSNSITRLADANAKLPKNMKLSPLSRMTVATAKIITRSMLEIEQAKIAQRFADEATERTIQHVIDATAPTSGHRGGKQRRAKPVDGAEAPDERAMAFLHEAAVEEMRLYRISTSGRMRSLELRAAAKLAEWRSEADPPLRADSPTAETPRRDFPHPPPLTADEPTNGRAANTHQTNGGTSQERSTGFAPLPTTPLDVVLGMTPNASEQQKQGIVNTMARMQAATEALMMAANGPEELAEAVKAMIAPTMQRREEARQAADPTTPTNQPEGDQPAPQAGPVQQEEPVAATTQQATEQSIVSNRNEKPVALPQQTETRPDGPGPAQTATTGRTPAPSAQSQIRRNPEAARMPASKPQGSQTTTHVAATAKTTGDLLEIPPGPTPTSSDVRQQDDPILERPTRDTTTTNATGSASPTNEQPQALTPAPSASLPASPDMPSTNVAAPAKTAAPPRVVPKGRILGPDDYPPKSKPFKPFERTPGVAPPQLRLGPTPKGGDENAPAPVRRDRDAAGPAHETPATTAPPPAVPKETVPAVFEADHAATEEDLRSEHARRLIEAERVEEKAKAEKRNQADAWAAQWADAAPKSDMDPDRISWVISSSPMRRDEPLQTMTNFIEKHPELELVYRSLADGYCELSVDAAAMMRLLTRVAPSDRDTWDEIGTGCFTAHQVNLAKQHGDIGESAWAKAWIAQAPRSILTFDHLTWTLSGVAQEDAVFEKLCGLLNRRSTMDIRPNRQERKLVMPIELLQVVLQNIVPDERPKWDQLGMECADASRVNDDRLYRQFEEVRSDEEARARSALDQSPETGSISTDRLVDRAKIATDQPSIPSSNPRTSSPPTQTETTLFQRLSKTLMGLIRPDMIRSDSLESGHHDVGSTEQAQGSSQSLDEQPLGIEFAAEMLRKRDVPIVRHNQKHGTVWIVAEAAVWNGTAPDASDKGARGLGPAFENIRVKWAAEAYPENPNLTIYRAEFSDLVKALGLMPPKALNNWLARLRRATISSDDHIRPLATTGTNVVEPPKQTAMAKNPVRPRTGHTPDGGIGL